MGHEIVYCNTCGSRIVESDFKKGQAITIQEKNYFDKCIDKASGPESNQQERKTETAPTHKIKTQRIPIADAPAPRKAAFRIPMPYIIAIGIGILAVILLLVVVSRGR